MITQQQAQYTKLADALELKGQSWQELKDREEACREAARIIRAAAAVDVAGLMAMHDAAVAAAISIALERKGDRHGPTRAALESALRMALAARAGWQPIETAPKDGTEIIMSNGKDVSAGSWFGGDDGTFDHDGAPNCDEREAGWMDWSGGMQPDPTRWMPLPAAPKGTP